MRLPAANKMAYLRAVPQEFYPDAEHYVIEYTECVWSDRCDAQSRFWDVGSRVTAPPPLWIYETTDT